MILEKINFPVDLRRLTIEELEILSHEIRKFLIENVSRTGGHLASSLGAVELTIGLHYVLNTPEDKIIWDVGHQTYPHKIITGRKDLFPSLRQHNGLSGFPKKDESVYDVFDAGHSSNSLSVALGLVCARDLLKQNHKVVAFLGDGALSGGMAFEGLNNIGHLKKNVIIILNDNEMSISRNVGGLSAYLNRVITNPLYNRMRNMIADKLKNYKGRFGLKLYSITRRLEEHAKALLVPGIIFEELGIRYFGPIDGHNVTQIIDTLMKVKDFKTPILIHALTKKGKGYLPAEENPTLFHSAPKYDIATGKSLKPKKGDTFTEAFSEAIVDFAEKDDKVVAITAAMCEGTGLTKFAEKFPDRFFDTGIAEEHAVTFSAGLALNGLKPVVAVYSTFLQRAIDQINQDVCLQNLHVTFVVDRAGLVGEDGPTHNGVFDVSLLRSFPNIVIMMPKDLREVRSMLGFALNLNGPVLIRYPKWSLDGDGFGNLETPVQLGKSEILKQGRDIAIIALGPMVYVANEAVKKLVEMDIHPTLINARFAKPIDEELIMQVAENHKFIITFEEQVLAGGFGSAVLEFMNAKGMDTANVKRIGLPDEFIEHGNVVKLREKYRIDDNAIVDYIVAQLNKSIPHRAFNKGEPSPTSREGFS